MTSFQRYRERTRDIQDHLERHVWGEQKYIKDGGSIIKVRGTDTEDEETAVLNIAGNSFNLPKGSNTEVVLLSGGSDTTLKLAVLTIPRDKQRRWAEGAGGVQHPTDPDVAIDLSDKLTHVTKNKFGVGEKGEFEVKENESYFRVDKLIVTGELIVNKKIKTPVVETGSEDPPDFEGSKQAEVSQDDQGGGGGGSSPAQLVLDF